MSRISPWSAAYRRPAPSVVSRSFRDPALGAEELALTFRIPGHFERGKMIDLARELTAQYVTGDEQQEPVELRDPDGDVLPMSAHMCADIAALMILEVPPDGEPQYSFLDWCGFAKKLEVAWPLILRWANELARRAHLTEPPAGNAEGAASTPDS